MKTFFTAASMFAATVAFSAGFVAVSFAQPAVAQENFDFSFDYVPEELASEQGAQMLLNRLKLEAGQACSEGARSGRPVNLSEDRACTREIVAKVVNQIGASTLASVHERRNAG